jgi:hypothetical protein
MDLLRFVGRAALAVWLLGSAGCSLALATDSEQCNVTADCTARGAAFAGTTCIDNTCQSPPPQCTVAADCAALGGSFANDICVSNKCVTDPKWGCIGNVAPLPSGGMTPVKVQLVDLINNSMPVTNVSVELCEKLDPTCATPLTPAPALDSMGNVTMTVASNFDGYLNITDPTMKYLPSLIFIDLVAVSKNPTILLVSNTEETGLTITAGVKVDPTAGLLLMPVVDCTSTVTAGVTVSAAPAGSETGFYLVAGEPSTMATQTDSSGDAGFVNAVAGDVTITGTLGSGGKEMGKVTTIVRAGAMTYQLVRPTSTL